MPSNERVERFREAERAYLADLGVPFSEVSVGLRRLGIQGRVLEAGHGPPLVLVHGGGGLAAGWGPLMAHLDGFRLLAVDRPGCGLTGFVPYRKADLRAHAAQFMDDVLDALELDRVSVVANSMGALWSLWFALARPDRVRRMALLGTPALILQTSAPGGMRLLGVPGLNRLMMAMEPPSEIQVRRLWRRMGHDDGVCTPEMVDLVVALQRLPGYKAGWLSLLERVLPMGRPDRSLHLTEDDLGRVTHPVLYVWGSDDPFGSVGVGRRARAATPGSRLEVLGQGHLPWLDDPGSCAALVSDFLLSDA